MIEIYNKSLANYTFIDLFAGIGGFRLALESFGAKCVFSSEWDKHAQQTYQANFGEIPMGDITKINEDFIPKHDILCAGFPCQAFSISGKQKGFEDSRGTLFFDVARIVKAKQPKIVFIENVKNFASHDNGNTLNIVKTTLNQLGYTIYYKVLNTADYGLPQKRERIYIVAFRQDLAITDFNFPEPIKLDKCLEACLLKQVDKNFYVNRNDVIFKDKQTSQLANQPIRIGTVNKGGQGERIYNPTGVAITLSASGGGIFAKTGGYLINDRLRRLHPRECARIMGFPDSFQLSKSNSQAYKQLGNSVSIDVLQYILLQVVEALKVKPISAIS